MLTIVTRYDVLREVDARDTRELLKESEARREALERELERVIRLGDSVIEAADAAFLSRGAPEAYRDARRAWDAAL